MMHSLTCTPRHIHYQVVKVLRDIEVPGHLQQQVLLGRIPDKTEPLKNRFKSP